MISSVQYNTFEIANTNTTPSASCAIWELFCSCCCTPVSILFGCYDGCVHVGCRASFRACTACANPEMCALFHQAVNGNANTIKNYQNTGQCGEEGNKYCLYPPTAIGCLVGLTFGLCFGGVAAPRNCFAKEQDLTIYDADDVFNDYVGEPSFLNDYAIN